MIIFYQESSRTNQTSRAIQVPKEKQHKKSAKSTSNKRTYPTDSIIFTFFYWIRELWGNDKEGKAYKPANLLKLLQKLNPIFAQGSQQDSQEFLAYILDILHEDLNRVQKKPSVQDQDFIEKPGEQKQTDEELENFSKESWKNYLERNKSVIIDLFQGQTQSTLTCLQCNTTSHQFEPLMYLSVPIPQQSNKRGFYADLEECIKEFSKVEKLEKQEQWLCPTCQSLEDASQKMDLWKLPNILVVHLKRFQFTRNQRRKLRTLIQFPIQQLDLSKLVTGKQRDLPIYELFAVCGTLSSGHYFTYAQNQMNENWYIYDDSTVKKLKNYQEKIQSSDAYVLFYSQITNDEFFRQTLSSPETWPHFFGENTKEYYEHDSIRQSQGKQSGIYTFKNESSLVKRKESRGKILNAAQSTLDFNHSSINNLSHNQSSHQFKKDSNRISESKGQIRNQLSMIGVNDYEDNHKVRGQLDDSLQEISLPQFPTITPASSKAKNLQPAVIKIQKSKDRIQTDSKDHFLVKNNDLVRGQRIFSSVDPNNFDRETKIISLPQKLQPIDRNQRAVTLRDQKNENPFLNYSQFENENPYNVSIKVPFNQRSVKPQISDEMHQEIMSSHQNLGTNQNINSSNQ